jgi:hypothetical protein
MKLIFIYGLPAVGKLTVARELATGTGFKLFHNHLVVDLLLSVFNFGAPEFVELREKIWHSVLAQWARSGTPGLIFTFTPEATVRPSFVPELLEMLAREEAEVDLVELTCPLEELRRRLDSPSRHQHQKLTSVALFEQLQAGGTFEPFPMPKPKLSLDTGRQSPAGTARQIAGALGLRWTA